MSYTKNTWVDQAGQVKYTKTDDGSYWILTPNYEDVTEMGTPVNADNLNHIEDGIEDAFEYVDAEIAELEARVVNLSGDETISGTKTFTSPIYTPNSTTTGTALSLAGRGYVANINNGNIAYWLKLGDGTLIQWGAAQMEAGRKTMLVSMPVAFTSNSAYRTFLSDRGGDNDNIETQKTFEYTSSSTFKVRSTANQDFFNWFAIGR